MAKKRANLEGSIYQRQSDGLWVGSITTGRDATGKLKRQVFYGKTQKDVRKRLTSVLVERDKGLAVEPSKQTVGQFLDSWMEDVKKGSVRPTTYATYGHVLKHAQPIRNVPLAKLTAQQVQRLLTGLQQGSDDSPGLGRTVQVLHAILHQAFDVAVKWNLVPRNIMLAVSVPNTEKEEIHPLTVEEAERFLAASEDDRLHALYVLALTCGLRFGEVLGLRWQEIDMKGKRLTLTHQLGKAGEFLPLKTQRSRRTLYLPEQALMALRKHRQRQNEERLKVGEIWTDLDLVFCTEVGTPCSQSNVRNRSFFPLLDKAGLRRIRFHDLRHTCATLLLSQGVHPRIVQEQLGHSKSSTTLDIYSHVTPPMMEDVAKTMDTILTKKKA